MPQIDQNNSISIYNGNITAQCIVKQVKKIKAAFPSLPAGFYDILTDRVKELGFSDERLTDAVNNMIDTCIYPTPTVANILTWDKRVKLFNYSQIIGMIDKSGPIIWEEYKAVDIPGMTSRVYASIIDIDRYGLKLK